MSEPQQKHWPDRAPNILVPTTILCVLSTLVLAWRISYTIRCSRKLSLSDCLMTIAAILSIVATGVRYRTCFHGQGRHIMDPSIRKPYDILQYSYYLWIGQTINIIAVAILKYSICSYLLLMRFSRVYLAIVWASILMVTTLNFVLPVMGMFCRTPFEANWNKSVKSKCFMTPNETITYTQGVSNCVTDLVYIAAPIVYLSTLQLRKRAKWRLRIVFCLGSIATACSIAKTIEMSALKKTRDPTWEGSNLNIWSACELSVGVLVASLPPLGKPIDSMLDRILPSSFLVTDPDNCPYNNGLPMFSISKQFTIGSKPTRERTRSKNYNDRDNDKYILKEAQQPEKDEIIRTISHGVCIDEHPGTQIADRIHKDHD
ncbi:hypothetical protein COCCADRAFT_28182 [Bipolaris zeicola 26-R-13]|uniref:Rhodopsin domain-containing protein n=1 Tax=Cochliobolus carbonum (strain 26-R-13) TaxID=930089 RepID=W6Y6V7_COCC2|nr:uncharacterized protein COCCADRAFT_28182 [Bipolaris zeicola 26-R-13]EUC30999.1 hypothetical protein COCCADRAFT_28182 [Bipolaris zeicola 26-R-13]